MADRDVLLSVERLTTVFDLASGPVPAVDDISFEIRQGETLGLVGESGSGKTTLVRCLVRLVQPDAGTATFDQVSIFDARAAELRRIRRRMQLIYQDPYSSLNPMLTVGASCNAKEPSPTQPATSRPHAQARARVRLSSVAPLVLLIVLLRERMPPARSACGPCSR